jgi:hypothetical protein
MLSGLFSFWEGIVYLPGTSENKGYLLIDLLIDYQMPIEYSIK